MIFWSKRQPSEKIVDLLGLKLEKDVSLDEAGKAYLASEKILYPSIAKSGVEDLCSVVDRKRKLSTFIVKDALHVFNTLVKKKDEGVAFRGRANLTNIIRFHITGEVPAPMPRNGDGDLKAPDIGKITIQRAKFDAIKHLIPLYSTKGRFGFLKGQVQQLIYELAADESGKLDVPKRSMTPKEATAMEKSIESMLVKGNFPYVIKFNPNESCFLIIHEKHLAGLIDGNKSKK